MKHISKISIFNAVIIILLSGSISACDKQEEQKDTLTELKSTDRKVVNNDVKTHNTVKEKQENIIESKQDKSTQIAIGDTDNSVKQAQSFTNIYSTTCMQYLNNLDKLREKLAVLPTLPQDKAKFFLNNMQNGMAYPVPDKYGEFVLALPKRQNICAVYARKANIETVQQQFHTIFSQAPKPLLVKTSQKNLNQQQTIISYEWYQQGANRKMLFMLSTNSAENASVQALFTASIVP